MRQQWKYLKKYILLMLLITVIFAMLIYSLITIDLIEEFENMSFPPEAIVFLAILLLLLPVLVIILLITIRIKKN